MRLRRLLPIVAVFVVVAAGCDWPNMVPPGNAPVRYRDPVFNAVTVTSNVTYGSAVNLERPDDHAASSTCTSRLATRSPVGRRSCGSTAARSVVAARRRPSWSTKRRRSPRRDIVNVSINYRLESPGCSGSLSNCVAAIQEAAADAQTAVRFLRTNAATYRIDPNRIAIGGSSAGAITALNVGYASSENPTARVRAAVSISGAHLGVGAMSAGRRPRPRLPLHDRPAGAVSVGGEHDQRGAGSGARRVPRILERDLPRAVRRAPSTDPRPVEELLVVGDGPRPRGNLRRQAAGSSS